MSKHTSSPPSSLSSSFLCQKTNKPEWVTSFQTLMLIIHNFDINYKLVTLIKECSSLLVEIMLVVVISFCQICIGSESGHGL